MKLHVWKNSDGIHLSRPPKPARLTEVDFDPDVNCVQCGEHVLSISADQTNICPWCESSMNRPKILRYQELDIIRLLQKQSDENKALESPQMPIIANKCTEKDLRDYLSQNGYFGRSAKFLKLDLAAIERPGWVQVFKLHVQVKRQDGCWEERFGTCSTDERNDTFKVELFAEEQQQSDTFRRDTSDMITHVRRPKHWSYTPLMLLFLLGLATSIVGALMTASGSGG